MKTEEKKVTFDGTNVSVPPNQQPVPDVVPKIEYDKLSADYQRIVMAYNKVLAIVANEYAERLTKSIFEEIDRNPQQQ